MDCHRNDIEYLGKKMKSIKERKEKGKIYLPKTALQPLYQGLSGLEIISVLSKLKAVDYFIGVTKYLKRYLVCLRYQKRRSDYISFCLTNKVGEGWKIVSQGYSFC